MKIAISHPISSAKESLEFCLSSQRTSSSYKSTVSGSHIAKLSNRDCGSMHSMFGKNFLFALGADNST